MSAICAVYRRDGTHAAAAGVRALLRAMAEYGEERHAWSDPDPEAGIALGCIPWRVTAEDAFHRGPVHAADGSASIVADVRLDNRGELIARLGMPAAEAATSCDAALVLAAWRRWGRAAPHHLVGDFAFVIWDARSRELICARDPIGQRVLFYHEGAAGIAVATTAQALATLPEVPRRLDEQKVADFLVLLQRPESTFFEGVRRVLPGHILIAGAAGVCHERYWSAMPERSLRLRTDEQYVEAFLEVFGNAVRSQLRSAGDVAMMTSGGLDSASVAAVAAQVLGEQGRRLPAYHAAPPIGFAGRPSRGMVVDESADVEALARMHPNIELHVQRNGGRSPFDDLESLFRAAGAPPRNPANSGWFFGIYRSAAAAGTRVLLTGHKGNNTISQTGLRSLRDAAVRGQWRRVWREVHALGRASGEGRRKVLRREVIDPLVPRLVTTVLRRPAPSLLEAQASAINPALARAANVDERLRAAGRHHEEQQRLSELQYRVIALEGGADVFDLYSGFRPWFGIETRDPTADRRVVEFCMAVPGSQFLRNGETRSLLRRAMVGRLPDPLRLRTTYGMQAPDWIEWLPSLHGAVRSELALLERSDTAARCLDLPRMRRLVDHWPDRFTLGHQRDYMLMLLRGLTMGRFIRWFEGGAA